MGWRKGHGRDKGKPHIEVLPPDELPQPLVKPSPEDTGPVFERVEGRITTPEAAKALGAKGGLAKAAKKRLMLGMGIEPSGDGDPYHQYNMYAVMIAEKQLTMLATMAGGFVGPAASSICCSAAKQMARARWLEAKAERIRGNSPEEITQVIKIVAQAEKLANSARQNFMAAYELSQREGKSSNQQDNKATNLFDVVTAESFADVSDLEKPDDS